MSLFRVKVYISEIPVQYVDILYDTGTILPSYISHFTKTKIREALKLIIVQYINSDIRAD